VRDVVCQGRRAVGFTLFPIAFVFATCTPAAAPPAPRRPIDAPVAPAVVPAEPAEEETVGDAGVHRKLRRRWAVGLSATEGSIIVRCNALPGRLQPEEDCTSCEPFVPCVDSASEPVMDGPRCRYTCKPTAGTKTYRLRCPNGTTPQWDARGCFCGPVRILRVCGNAAPVGVAVSGGVCSVTCP
jgi:hypothetical protein